MKRLSLKDIKGWKTEKKSTAVLYILVTLTVLVFGAFFFIGFDTPYEEDPTFNAPMLTDAVLIFIYLLIILASALAVIAIVRGIKTRDRSADVINNIPATRIMFCTFGLLVACMAITLLLGSSEPVMVNGIKYIDTFWLKATDMFINTMIILLVIAICGVAFGLSGYNRKIKLKKK
ncbi:MAG: hypothetical protein Q4D41_10975 [Prevotellaceae bacterium]|nr:hypothetical protein [Prevotellaceae bacterium]